MRCGICSPFGRDRIHDPVIREFERLLRDEQRSVPHSSSAITEPEKLPEAVSEFDDALRGSLADHVTVGKDRRMVFTLLGGTETGAVKNYKQIDR